MISIDFTKPRTSWVAHALLIILFIVLHGERIETFGMSKIVGHAWHFNNFAPFLTFLSLIIFLLGYSAMGLLKMEVNKVMSLFNLSFILNATVLFDGLSIAMALFAMNMFITNVILSIKIKMIEKKKSLEYNFLIFAV